MTQPTKIPRAVALEWLRVLAGAGASAVIATLLSLVVLAVPLSQLRSAWGSGDLLSSAVNVEYWSGLTYAVTTHAGYPFGMNLNLVSALDVTGNTVAAVIAHLTGSPFVGVNLLLVLSFPAVAAATYLLMRMVGLCKTRPGIVLAIALSASYAVIPYHWSRGLGHVYLATMLPGVVTVALALLVGRGDLRGWLRSRTTSGRVFRSLVLLAMVLICALSGLYAATFALLLVGVAALWQLITAPAPVRRALPVLLIPVSLAAIAACAALPTLLARGQTMLLAELGARDPAESVIFAGSLLLAVLPLALMTYGARIPGLQGLHDRLTGMLADLPELESTSLGAFGTVVTSAALLVLVAGSLLALRAPRPWSQQLKLIWVLLGATVLAFVPWGLGAFLALTISPQVRAWNRLLPILLLLIVVGAAVVLARVRPPDRLRAPWAPLLLAGVAVALVGVVVAESLLPFRGPYLRSLARAETLQQSAERYATAVNNALPQDCAILQLPYMAYPEQGVIEPRLNDYEHFWQVLTNPSKQWSYGALRNTSASAWAAALPQIPTAQQRVQLSAAGFCAIHLDRRGYRPSAWRAITEVLDTDLGSPVATGLQGRWRLYALGEPGALLTGDPQQWPVPARALLLAPVLLDADLGPRRTRLTSSWYQLASSTSRADLVAVDPALPVTGVQGWLEAPACGPVPVQLRLGDLGSGDSGQVQVTARAGERVPFRISIPASERAQLTIRAVGPACSDPPGFTPWIARIGDIVALTAQAGADP